MKISVLSIFLVGLIAFLQGCNGVKSESVEESFLLPFEKKLELNPVLTPREESEFRCPMRDSVVQWEEKDVFNPATVVKGDTLFLIYRAEDVVGKYNGTSRLGLAYSLDGYQFVKEPEPVLYPQNDNYKEYEWEGGCEDPRIVQDGKGIYYLTYTAYDGDKARLFIATSTDLRNWTKHGSVFQKAGNEYLDMWCKAGAIVCREENGKLIATEINGKYWMYWGESNIYMATSDNLIDWTPIQEENPEKMYIDTMRNYTKAFKILFSPRSGKFDSELVEPGPPAILTKAGILFIYNSKNSPEYGDKNIAPGTYAAGQVIINKDDPMKVIDRLENYFIAPDQAYEITGQVDNVCFVEGLSYFKGKWFLYYGTADSKIAVAESDKKLLRISN